MTPWRIFHDAARADARALRLLPIGTRCAPTDLAAALDDAEYLEERERSNERVRAWRGRVA